MAEKVILVAFQGDPMCFVHVLLNALDMYGRGFDVKVVIEGAATKTANALNEPGAQFGKFYQQVKGKGLIDCVCKACANTVGALAGIEAQGLPLCGEMVGHPSLARYVVEGYQVITF